MEKSRRASVISRSLLVFTAIVVVLALAAGLFGRKALYATGLLSDPVHSSFDPAVFDDGDSTAAPGVPGPPILEPAQPRTGVRADQVADRIARVGPIGGQMFGSVIDASSGEQVFDANSAGVGVPASTLKVLTTTAALDIYGPDHRFTTKVVADPAQPGKVWLVGGGDPLLGKSGGPSNLAALAADAAKALKDSGGVAEGSAVQVAFDASLFAGPGWNNDWLPGYSDYVTPISALWADEGRRTDKSIGPREADPARAATDFFAAELGRHGVRASVTGPGAAPSIPDGAASPAPETGVHTIAHVDSAPLENIVEHVLVHSDNDAAEILARHVGRDGGGDGSIAAAQEATRARLQNLGLWTDSMQISDGSGLSRENRVSPRALTGAVRLAVDPNNTRHRAVATGMSVAGSEGTLAGRFSTDGTEAGKGLVRAKTGTLTQVHSLAGYVHAEDGSVLVYSFIVNGDPNEYGTRVWLDKVTSALAACGCH